MRLFICPLIFLYVTCAFAFAQEDESFIYDDKGRQDPFSPVVGKNGRYLLETEVFYSPDELNLSGILWDPQGASSCLINNQIVKIGESIGGFMVENITKDSVTITKDGKEYILRLSIEKKE